MLSQYVLPPFRLTHANIFQSLRDRVMLQSSSALIALPTCPRTSRPSFSIHRGVKHPAFDVGSFVFITAPLLSRTTGAVGTFPFYGHSAVLSLYSSHTELSRRSFLRGYHFRRPPTNCKTRRHRTRIRLNSSTWSDAGGAPLAFDEISSHVCGCLGTRWASGVG